MEEQPQTVQDPEADAGTFSRYDLQRFLGRRAVFVQEPVYVPVEQLENFQ